MRSIYSTSRPTRNIKKIIALSIGALLLIIAGTLYYTETHHLTNFFTTSAPIPTTPAQKEEATKNDPTTSAGSAKNQTQPAPGVNNSQTTSQVPTSTSSSISITSLTESTSSVDLTAAITNPASSGVCTVTFTKQGAKPVTRTINTSSNTCSTSIPQLEFSMLGDWNVQVIYFANNTQTSTTGTITIK